MKTISILIPTYSEKDNIFPLYDAIYDELSKKLPEYSYEIIFIDNDSKDGTREKLIELCREDITSKLYLIHVTLDSLIPHTMGYNRHLETAQFFYVLTFKTL